MVSLRLTTMVSLRLTTMVCYRLTTMTKLSMLRNWLENLLKENLLEENLLKNNLLKMNLLKRNTSETTNIIHFALYFECQIVELIDSELGEFKQNYSCSNDSQLRLIC